MKTLLFTAAILLTGFSGFSQRPNESREDYIQRMWLSADTVALKQSYEASKIYMNLPKPDNTFQEQLILQQRQFDHEWEMQYLNIIAPRYYYIRIR